LGLAQPVQVDAVFDVGLAHCNAAHLPAIDDLGRRQYRGARDRARRTRPLGSGMLLPRLGAWRAWGELGLPCLARAQCDGNARLALPAQERARRVLPKHFFAHGDGAAASAGALAGLLHRGVLTTVVRPKSLPCSASTGAVLGSSTMNLPTCLVTPAIRPAAAPE